MNSDTGEVKPMSELTSEELENPVWQPLPEALREKLKGMSRFNRRLWAKSRVMKIEAFLAYIEKSHEAAVQAEDNAANAPEGTDPAMVRAAIEHFKGYQKALEDVFNFFDSTGKS